MPEKLAVVRPPAGRDPNNGRSDRIKKTHERRKQGGDPFEVAKDLGDAEELEKVREILILY